MPNGKNGGVRQGLTAEILPHGDLPAQFLCADQTRGEEDNPLIGKTDFAGNLSISNDLRHLPAVG